MNHDWLQVISCRNSSFLDILLPRNPMEVVTWHLLFHFSSKERDNSMGMFVGENKSLREKPPTAQITF